MRSSSRTERASSGSSSLRVAAAGRSGSLAGRLPLLQGSGLFSEGFSSASEGGGRSSSSMSRSLRQLSRLPGGRCRDVPASCPRPRSTGLVRRFSPQFSAARRRSSSRVRTRPVALAPGIPRSLVLAVVFVRRELRHPDPVFQPRFFAGSPLRGCERRDLFEQPCLLHGPPRDSDSSSRAISTGRACRSGSLSHCSPPRWSSSPRSAVGWPTATAGGCRP